MTVFNKVMQQLDVLVSQDGFVATANAITALYERDVLTYAQARNLRFQLAIKAEKGAHNCEEAQLLIGLDHIDLSEHVEVVSVPAHCNRYRLDNNQMTEWVNLPIHNMPEPQLQVGRCVAFHAV